MFQALPQDEVFKQVFATLPATVQETIKQSSVDLQNVDDLRRFAENLMRGRGQVG